MKKPTLNPTHVSLARGAASTIANRVKHGLPLDDSWSVSAALRRAGASDAEVDALLGDKREFARLVDRAGSPSLVR